LRPVREKIGGDPHLNKKNPKKLGIVVSTCHHSYLRDINMRTRRIVVQAGLGINMGPYSKNK
jgi:hypothetical protein